MVSQHSEPPAPDETWDNAVAHQDAYRNGLDPSFDPGHLPYHLFVNAGIEFLQPHLENSTAFTHFQTQTVGGVSQPQSGVTSFILDSEFTPRVTLGGSLDSGWGVRTTWWHFAENSNPLTAFNVDRTGRTVIRSTPISGIPGFSTPGSVARQFGVFDNTMLFDSHLETHVWDAEFTRALDTGGWCFLLSAGVRYTYLPRVTRPCAITQAPAEAALPASPFARTRIKSSAATT
jgi:hypothetical protein